MVLSDVAERGAGGVEHGRQVAQRAVGLGLDAVEELAGRGVDADLPAAEHEAVGGDALAVGPEGAGRVARGDRGSGHGCLPGSPAAGEDRGREDERRPGPRRRQLAAGVRLAHAVRGGRRLVARRIDGPVRRAGARQADRPGEQPEERALERHEAGLDDRGRRREVVGGGEHAGARQQVRRPAAPCGARRRGASTRGGRRRRRAARRRRTPRTPPASRCRRPGVTIRRPGRSPAAGRVAQPARAA